MNVSKGLLALTLGVMVSGAMAGEAIDLLSLPDGRRNDAGEKPFVITKRGAQLVDSSEGADGRVLKVGGADSQSNYTIYIPHAIGAAPFVFELRGDAGAAGWLGVSFRPPRNSSTQSFGLGMGSKGHLKIEGTTPISLPRMEGGGGVSWRVTVNPSEKTFNVSVNGAPEISHEFSSEIDVIETISFSHVVGQGGFTEPATVLSATLTPGGNSEGEEKVTNTH